jgi:hypothetical protein
MEDQIIADGVDGGDSSQLPSGRARRERLDVLLKKSAPAHDIT